MALNDFIEWGGPALDGWVYVPVYRRYFYNGLVVAEVSAKPTGGAFLVVLVWADSFSLPKKMWSADYESIEDAKAEATVYAKRARMEARR